MAPPSRVALAALLAVNGAAALQIPLQQLLDTPRQLIWGDASVSRPLVDSETLQADIKTHALKTRAEALWEVAKLSEDEYNHPTRVIGSKGHLGTLDYIYAELLKLGDYYTLTRQGFPAVAGSVFESRLVIGNDVPESATPMGLTPATKDKQPVHGDLVLVKNSGCDAEDYPAEVAGNIAFIKRGVCAFGTKSDHAGRAGAVAAVVYNTDKEELHGTLGTPTPYHVATFGLGGEEGGKIAKKLADGEDIDAIAYIDAVVSTIVTTNIIARTVRGDQDHCVMLGGHSDSVAEGPGINDDGSGTISVLEVATQLAKYDVNNCVQFGFFAGEEEGLLGSDYFVSSLTDDEKSKIALFMDYDMMASPNFAYQVYNATNEENPAGSAEIKQLYIDWYEAHDLNYTLIPFDGRSDYDGFIRNGIPGGGVACGAEGVKTKEEQEMFGGEAGEWFDSCYHQLCDDLNNVNYTAWQTNTELIAHSVATYALSLDSLPKREQSFKADTYDQKVKNHGHKLVM
ncbi:hypothetical protein S7711_05164 [Stachybotrys chartarum IBT 7711]|uniref:Peptide hydrolase n=1 Tax=Stachybotrys chartarum (strain CBS 109288 / IBT 7711) TaxID=1280523 RepID=A0A084B4L0_STACB|nr:hypothetical protein S7711_05164 [Stachybotrys chartarum IBT 7711]KFA48375.1 hypothetical protein S40293_04443 [Stachybotrys chartarum IBT 40293]KFA74270.1 hypothetical protein S40288_08715 [Stachybotrys chartarum IBT 40288]